jgi:hypothetical protein
MDTNKVTREQVEAARANLARLERQFDAQEYDAMQARLATVNCDDPARLREIYPDGNFPEGF